MIVMCTACRSFIREKEPLDDFRVSHGLCEICLKKTELNTKTETSDAKTETIDAKICDKCGQ